MNSRRLMLPVRVLCLVSLVATLAAQSTRQPPQEVLQKTPPPQGAGQSVFLADGTKLVPAADPVAERQAGNSILLVPPQQRATVQGDNGPDFSNQEGTVTQKIHRTGTAEPAAADDKSFESIIKTLESQGKAIEEGLKATQSIADGNASGKRREDGLDVDPESALIRAQLDPKTGKPRRRASQIAEESGLVMIPAGTVITIRTSSRIQTQLGGTCLAVIDNDVMSAQFDAVAIPKGSKLLGAIQTVGNDGQDRAAVIFRQIVDLNGDQIQLMVPEPATDRIGQAGVTGRINRHLGVKFGSAFAWGILSGLTGSGSKSVNSTGATFADVVQSNVASSFGQVGQTYLQQAIAIRSDIEVPQNTQMRIIIGNPIYIKAWKRKRPW